MKCVHCKKGARSRPRGLCWTCYYSPAIRDLYEPTGKHGRRGIGNGYGGHRPPDAPTDALPGTPAKVAVLERRAEQMRSLWHQSDA